MKYKSTIVIEWESIPIDKGSDCREVAEIVTGTLASGACEHVDKNRHSTILDGECTFTETVKIAW